MKAKTIVVFLLLLAPAIVAQEIKLSSVNKPGDTGTGAIVGAVLGENLIGPYKVMFSGASPGSGLPVLSRAKLMSHGSAFDALTTLYSGRIYSPGVSEPFIFTDKTALELVQMEIPVHPTILEQPYTLFMDLTVKASSKPKGDVTSNDAGDYTALLTVSLVKL